MRSAALSAALFLLAAGLTGCAKDSGDTGGGYTFNGDGLTYAGLYNLVAELEPDPPAVGNAGLDMILTTASDGALVEAATLSVVVADASGDTLPMPPMVGLEGGGSYVASWSFTEAGAWSIRVNIEDEAGSDYALWYVTVN